ncbi:MAG: hypothetical protein JOZ96_06035 [Acidobacteria bacterium]|nr:hypothetical protein [Acidobacteriota bacterium]
MRFDFEAFLAGAVLVVASGWALVLRVVPGATVAVVLLSSTVGLDGTGVGCGVAAGAGVLASVTGSVSPLAPSQAFQPPRSARAL